EAYDLLLTAYQTEGPFAIRYPRGNVESITPKYENWNAIDIGSWEIVTPGKDLYIVSMGPVMNDLCQLARDLLNEKGIEIGVINARFIKPMDLNMLNQLASLEVPVIIYEENALIGGLGTGIIEYYTDTLQEVKIKRLGIPDVYVQHGQVSQILDELQLSLSHVKDEILLMLEK
ncbi:MAG: transketolase C-terminal domain-containing protein, partial [Turicibacter sp.]